VIPKNLKGPEGPFFVGEENRMLSDYTRRFLQLGIQHSTTISLVGTPDGATTYVGTSKINLEKDQKYFFLPRSFLILATSTNQSHYEKFPPPPYALRIHSKRFC
jgi:hypothetical protein